MPSEKVRSLSKSLHTDSQQTILQMIDAWEKGCFNSHPNHPEGCTACTLALIQAIKQHELRISSSCITVGFTEAYTRIREVCEGPPLLENRGFGSKRIFERNDILLLLQEYKTMRYLTDI